MPDLAKILILAVVQGLTEFLPVSSSGHLVIAKHFLDLDTPDVTLEVTIHAGTLLAVMVYYRWRIQSFMHDVRVLNRQGRHDLVTLACGTVPILIAGIVFKPQIECLFDQPRIAAAMLIVTGLVLCSLFLSRPKPRTMTAPLALLVGIVQAIALLPGISRAGTTIAIARHAGISPQKAAEFSLLLMIPAVGGAIILALRDVAQTGIGSISGVALLLALITSALVGYAAIVLVVKALSAGYFQWFGFYCLAVGAVGVLA